MFSIYSSIPYFLITALLLLCAEAIARGVPFYRRALAPQPQRFEVLDGLRGFLALSVFLLHSNTHYFFARTHKWGESPVIFYSVMGQIGVMCFFFITGFLFWSKAIEANGRIGFWRLMKNRYRRLAPAYYLMSVVVVILVFAQTGPHIVARPWPLFAQIVRMVSVSIVPGVGILNGVPIGPLICGVIWTLTFEWAFYILLPLTGRLATPRLVWILAVPSFVLAAFYPVAALLLCFIFGMLAAHLVRLVDLRPIAGKMWFGVVPLAFIAAVVKFTAPYPYLSPLASLLLAIAMLAFLYGCDLFGLLRTRGARLLSAASYSIYLLHGLVLYITLRLIGRDWGTERMESPRYWLLVSGIGVALVIVSAISYAVVEHPFIARRTPAGSAKPQADAAQSELPPATPSSAAPVPAISA